MIRFHCSRLERRINARSGERTARIAEAITRVAEIKDLVRHPDLLLEQPEIIVDLNLGGQSIASKASLNTRSVKPSAQDETSLVSSRSSKVLSSEDLR